MPKESGSSAPTTLVATTAPVPRKARFTIPAPGSSSSSGSATRASLPCGQRRSETTGEHVVAVAGDGTLPAGGGHARSPRRVVEQLAQRVGDVTGVIRSPHHEARL